MKRAPLAALAFFFAACGLPKHNTQDAFSPEKVSLTASAYTYARQCVLDELARKGERNQGWFIPTTSAEAWVLEDTLDPSIYRLTFSSTRPGRESRAWTVTLRKVGEAWQLLKIESQKI